MCVCPRRGHWWRLDRAALRSLSVGTDWAGLSSCWVAGQDTVGSRCPRGQWEGPLSQCLGCSRSRAPEGGKQVAVRAVEFHCAKFSPGLCPGVGGTQLVPPVATLGASPKDRAPGCVPSSSFLGSEAGTVRRRQGLSLHVLWHRWALSYQRRGEQLAGAHAEPCWSSPSAASCRAQWDPLEPTTSPDSETRPQIRVNASSNP